MVIYYSYNGVNYSFDFNSSTRKLRIHFEVFIIYNLSFFKFSTGKVLKLFFFFITFPHSIYILPE